VLKHVYGHPARFGALFLLCAALSGCGREPPGCADEKTVALVKDAFWSAVASNAVDQNEKALLAAVRSKFEVTVELPRVAEKQSDAGKLLCAADLKVKLGTEAAKSVDKLFRRESGATVGYSSQITADGEKHVVEVAGYEVPIEHVWSLVKMGAFNAFQAAPGKNSASPPAPPGRETPAFSMAPAGSGSQEPPASATSGLAEADYQTADKALNDAYQGARAALPEARRVALRDEQRNWIKRRDEACSENAIKTETTGAVAGGSAMELERLSCKARMTQERTKQLLGK
jgi:uncharacterized protein YecT (DUF1311 family)